MMQFCLNSPWWSIPTFIASALLFWLGITIAVLSNFGAPSKKGIWFSNVLCFVTFMTGASSLVMIVLGVFLTFLNAVRN